MKKYAFKFKVVKDPVTTILEETARVVNSKVEFDRIVLSKIIKLLGIPK